MARYAGTRVWTNFSPRIRKKKQRNFGVRQPQLPLLFRTRVKLRGLALAGEDDPVPEVAPILQRKIDRIVSTPT